MHCFEIMPYIKPQMQKLAALDLYGKKSVSCFEAKLETKRLKTFEKGFIGTPYIVRFTVSRSLS